MMGIVDDYDSCDEVANIISVLGKDQKPLANAAETNAVHAL